MLKNKNIQLKNTNLIVKQKIRENEYIYTQQAMQNKINTLSKIIVSKSRELAREIKLGPYTNEPEINKLVQNLEQMSLIDSAVDTDEINEILLKQPNYLNAFNDDNLSKSEVKILILSVEKFKSKEISTSLNLSYSYVRNVQSKLRKLLRLKGINSFVKLSEAFKF